MGRKLLFGILAIILIAGLGAVLLLGEQPSLRLLLCGIAVLGGIALVIARPAAGNIITHPHQETAK